MISMTIRSGATWALSRESIRALPRNCGSLIVAGRVLTKIFAFEGIRAEESRGPLPAEAVELDQQVVRGRGPEEGVGRLQARAPRPPREGLEAHDRPLLHAQDRLVGGHDALAQEHVLQPLEHQQLVRPAEVGGLRERLLEGALDHPVGVQERVVDGEPVAHLDAGGGLDVGERRASQVRHERGHEPAARGAQVGHREGDVPPPLAVEQEQEAQAPRPVEAEDVSLPVVLAARLLEDLEDPLPHLLVGGRPVLVLDRPEAGGVEDQDPEAAALRQLALEVREPLVVGGDGLGHCACGSPA